MLSNAVRRLSFSLFGLVAAICLQTAPTQAEAPPAPTGEAILFVDGAIPEAGGAEYSYDLAGLAALGETTFSTSTTWTDGTPTFTGVPLKKLLDSIGVTSGMVSAVALNNYAVDIPVDSLTDDAPIIAYAIDGKPFPRRDKGPLWIVYPYDSSADYRNELIYNRSIWQLQRLTVK